MSVSMNGIAHIQLTVRDPDRCLPFWEKLLHFLEMKTLIKGDDILYCIGSRTGWSGSIRTEARTPTRPSSRASSQRSPIWTTSSPGTRSRRTPSWSR